MAAGHKPDITDGEESLSDLRAKGDRLLAQYENTMKPERKARLFIDIVNQYYIVSRLGGDSSDIDKCQKLLRMASEMNLISFREFEEYTDSLNMIQRRK